MPHFWPTFSWTGDPPGKHDEIGSKGIIIINSDAPFNDEAFSNYLDNEKYSNDVHTKDIV